MVSVVNTRRWINVPSDDRRTTHPVLRASVQPQARRAYKGKAGDWPRLYRHSGVEIQMQTLVDGLPLLQLLDWQSLSEMQDPPVGTLPPPQSGSLLSLRPSQSLSSPSVQLVSLVSVAVQDPLPLPLGARSSHWLTWS